MTNEGLMELMLTTNVYNELLRHRNTLESFRVQAQSPHLDKILADAIDNINNSIEEL